MKINWKYYTLVLGVLVLASVTGCGGFNTTQSVSPASFFLPGLLMDPRPLPPALDKLQPALPLNPAVTNSNI